ncbi:MAG: hypothetical protein AAFR45_10095 [Pseudomonadota bacterium]
MITLDDLQGHWVRDWIKAPGFEDHSTRVHWMQVGHHYADVRVPADRPDISEARALCELAATDLHSLAEAEGFAGHVTLKDRTCTWHREINWHGTPQSQDVGTISFDQQGRMIEEGVHADYTERWDQHAGDGAEALKLSNDGYAGYLITRGQIFVLGIGVTAKPASGPLISALGAGGIPDGIADLFDGLHAIGHWSGAHGIATLATDPFVEQSVVLHRRGETIGWTRTDFWGNVSELTFGLQSIPT